MSAQSVKMLLLTICVLIVLLILKSVSSTLAKSVTIISSVIVMICIANNLVPIITFVSTLSNKAGIDNAYIAMILKCVGISLLGEYTLQLCKDCGESTLSSVTELLTKTTILIISLPMYNDILNIIFKLWEK